MHGGQYRVYCNDSHPQLTCVLSDILRKSSVSFAAERWIEVSLLNIFYNSLTL